MNGASLRVRGGVPKSGQEWVPDFDQKSPLFAPFRALSRQLCGSERWPSTDEYTELFARVCRERQLDLGPLKFAAQPKKARRAKREAVVLEELYDGSIALRGEVPCLTESYHDLFNALIFAAFPLSKRALHARQFRALSERVEPGMKRLPEARTREQDALTVFDEGGSVVLVSREFHERWSGEKPWTLLDVADGQAQLWLFGHALLEHVFYGRYELRSCAVVLVRDETTPCGDEDVLPWLDRRVAQLLGDTRRFRAPGADGVVRIDERSATWLGAGLP